MPSGQPKDQLPFDVRFSLEGEIKHRPVATLLAVPRNIRHPALYIIMKELSLDTERYKETLRNIGHLIFDYRRLKTVSSNQLTPSEVVAWYMKIARASSALLSLLEDDRAILTKLDRTVHWSPELNIKLRAMSFSASATARALPFVRENLKLSKKGRLPDLATKRLIRNLEHMYRVECGRETGLSRSNRHYDRDRNKQGTPEGPLFRMAEAMFLLLGEPKTPEQLAMAIRRRNMGS